MKNGKTRLFFNSSPKYGTIALVGIGSENVDYSHDGYDGVKENIRIAAASNIKTCVFI